MSEKKVSIVLPIYNGTRYIASSIESILEQNYANWELIIVNDCSTDDTLSICNKYAKKDSRISVFSNERNLKLPKTLNEGFSRATGDYYTWTSDDNLYKPSAIGTLVAALEDNPGVSMVYSDYTNIDADGNIIGETRLQKPEFLVTGNVCGACFLYTAEISATVGEYDPNMFLAEDYDYWLRIHKDGKLMHINDNLYLYRRHSESLSETRKTTIVEQTFRVLEKNFFSMYTHAKRNHLKYAFFDYMLGCSGNRCSETVKLLISMDKRYGLRLGIKGLLKRLYQW